MGVIEVIFIIIGTIVTYDFIRHAGAWLLIMLGMDEWTRSMINEQIVKLEMATLLRFAVSILSWLVVYTIK